MNGQLKNTLIGAFVSIAIGLIIGMILFVEPTVGDGKQLLRVYFSNISGISDGTRVTLAGRIIGDVAQINQIPDARQKAPTHDKETVYFYEVTLQVDSKATIYTTDKISIKTIGLLGDTIIAVIPTYLPSNVKPVAVTPDTPMYATSSDLFEQAFDELSSLATEMEKTFQKVNDWLDENHKNLTVAVHYFGEAFKQVAIATDQFNQMGVMKDIKTSIVAFSQGMELVDEALVKIKEEGGFDQIPQIICHVNKITDSVSTIASTMAEGKGTVGELLMNDEAYLKFNAILTKVNMTLNDINQYGLLYFYNNDWKRAHLKKMTQLNEIATPTQFRDYYTQDLDEMNRAVARIGQLATGCEKPYYRTEKFYKEFKMLQDQLKELQKSLNLLQDELAFPDCKDAKWNCVPSPTTENKNCGCNEKN